MIMVDLMTITNGKYVQVDGVNSSITATIDGQTMSVPLDSANRHYQAILEWAKEDGNEIAEAD